MIEAEPLVIACIPTCNEEKAIAKVILQTKKYVERVVVCDGGSTDLTAEIAERLGADVIRHETPEGYGVAVGSCFRAANVLGADVVVVLDAVRHDPAEIGRVVKPILEGKADVSVREWFEAGQGGFAAFSRDAIKRLGLDKKGVEVNAEMLQRAEQDGLRVVDVRPGVLESAVIRVLKRPLVFFGLPGVILTTLGVLLGAWLLLGYILEHEIVTGVALAFFVTMVAGIVFLGTAGVLNAILKLDVRRGEIKSEVEPKK